MKNNNTMKTMKIPYTNEEVKEYFTNAIKTAGLSELEALDKKLDRHYNAGTIKASDYRSLTFAIFEEICRFDCLTHN
jgi:hypothetical protein